MQSNSTTSSKTCNQRAQLPRSPREKNSRQDVRTRVNYAARSCDAHAIVITHTRCHVTLVTCTCVGGLYWEPGGRNALSFRCAQLALGEVGSSGLSLKTNGTLGVDRELTEATSINCSIRSSVARQDAQLLKLHGRRLSVEPVLQPSTPSFLSLSFSRLTVWHLKCPKTISKHVLKRLGVGR